MSFRYEYRCSACDEVLITGDRLEPDTNAEYHTVETCFGDVACGRWKRIWSTPAIVWPNDQRGH